MHHPVLRASARAAGSSHARASTSRTNNAAQCELYKIGRAEANRIMQRQERAEDLRHPTPSILNVYNPLQCETRASACRY